MWRRRHKRGREIELDEIFIDSSNLPSFNRGRMEGRLETPLERRNIISVGVVFFLILSVFLFKLFSLQVVEGNEFALVSERNRLDKTVIFSERGVIYDRTGERLAWNTEAEGIQDFAQRQYSDRRGLGQLLGYISYPQKDSAGFYYRTEYIGRGGAEQAYEEELEGENGEQLIEVDARGQLVSAHVVHAPEPGKSITLSIDAALSEALYDIIATTTAERGFTSGTGAIMDVETGEIIALANFPSFDPEVMASGTNRELIKSYNEDERLPFLNKFISGVYTPGSIIKPFVAFAALSEHIVDPLKTFVSTGKLVVPNPYNPDNPSIFTDWKAHGAVDMRRAIAVSSNVYFYIVGGGFGDQKGLGITKLNQHLNRFGLGTTTGIALPGEVAGTVPSPAWKEEAFEDGTWRLGDTYLTSIGQFGFQTTPIEILRGYAAIANGGTLVTPTVLKDHVGEKVELNLNPADRQVVIEGMRGSVVDGTARAINRSDIIFAGKTGTAELGASKAYVNSWVGGFFPYESPKYAFVLLMEHGPRENLFGSSPAFSQFLMWAVKNKPEYFLSEEE